MAITKRIWMNPPMVYELTKPSSHNTSKMTAIVSSIFLPSYINKLTMAQAQGENSDDGRQT